MSCVSREIMVKAWEIEVENVRFAVENAIKLRQIALSTAADYIKAVAEGIFSPTVAMMEKMNDGQSKLISAASAFYNSRTNASEMMWKARLSTSEMQLDASKVNAANVVTIERVRADALLEATRNAAQKITSVLNNIHVQGSNSTSFSAGEEI